MHAVTWRSARAARRIPAQVIAGRRFPPRLRTFHRSARLYSSNGSPDEPRDPATPSVSEHDNGKPGQAANGSPPAADSPPHDVGADIAVEAAEDSPAVLAEKSRKARRLYQAALKRSSRTKQAEDFPPIEIPQRFFHNNVTIREDREHCQDNAGSAVGGGPPKPEGRGSLCLSWVGKDSEEKELAKLALPLPERLYKMLEMTAEEKIHAESLVGYEEILEYVDKLYTAKIQGSTPEHELPSLDKSLHFALYLEVLAAISGSLATAKPELASSFPSAKSNLLLHAPHEGGIARLDQLVDDVAADLQADVVKIDSQDIAELVGDYLEDGSDPNAHSLRSLGYEAYRPKSDIDLEEDEFDEMEAEEEAEDGQEEPMPSAGGRMSPAPRGNKKGSVQRSMSERRDSDQMFKDGLPADFFEFETAERKRNEQINIRHIQDMIRRLDPGAESKENVFKPTPIKTASDIKLEKVQRTANKHEKKLLLGVVNPSNIKTTFSDVHAPEETTDALKTMTSLSLLRPDAFSYGVLATDKIPGLLLYGPPGTGKTLLAKAVAKESGATVLEVSGSEVYDMYVGEGEKNVRAIFSLARKLSPCVVFIDEADAMFGSRSGSRHRTSHREVLNQFLKEWDGMNDLSVFIMVATNRPFDMDEAVLRRLPRRLLVDLPTQKDRESILKIHLKDEQLDPAIKLDQLAKDTPFYSGSDLKNLCVAAALNCVREENDYVAAARAHQEAVAAAAAASPPATEEGSKDDGAQGQAAATTNEHGSAADAAKGVVDHELEHTFRPPSETVPYPYPAKRTLLAHHFEKAMQEISASISEDMATLTAIRKFDEQYGDKRGNRRKKSSWGFNVAADVGPGEEAARVRPAAAAASGGASWPSARR
ncbi:putative mitochondrial aaa atpase [Diplodia seriata]|uniref:Putative mitochondrial aaa atpase n=1 Tax=Diplodia seriata TaxID=420778 RepID=A0A0G2H091_9PEZI|nr:putative mitochondrial aaa atpase [Diplodia seriata]